MCCFSSQVFKLYVFAIFSENDGYAEHDVNETEQYMEYRQAHDNTGEADDDNGVDHSENTSWV